MDRRKFINTVSAGVISAPAIFRSETFASQIEPLLQNSETDRVMVYIDLSGGCDGLNMLPPLEQYEELKKYRENIILPENQILRLDSETGMHPSMPHLYQMFQQKELSIVHGVSYPEPNMSHFRSREILWSGSNSKDYVETGWMGRSLNVDHPIFPDEYPNSEFSEPIALSFNSKTSLITQGPNSNFATVSNNPNKLSSFKQDNISTYTADDGRYAEELDFLRTSQRLSVAYNQNLYDSYRSGPEIGKGNSGLGTDLKDVVRLIKAGSKTKIYVLTQGGYDTHKGQVISGDATLGKHADLLGELSEAIGTFMQDLKDQNIDKKVIGLVSTEFGRRIMSNASLGCDHGHAAPWLLFGTPTTGQIFGKGSVLPNVVDKKSNVPMQHDHRDIYSSLLKDWFQLPKASVDSMFTHRNQHIDFFGIESTTSMFKNTSSPIFMNNGKITLPIDSFANGLLRIEIMDGRGRIVSSKSTNIMSNQKEVLMMFNHSNINNYYYRIRQKTLVHQGRLLFTK